MLVCYPCFQVLAPYGNYLNPWAIYAFDSQHTAQSEPLSNKMYLFLMKSFLKTQLPPPNLHPKLNKKSIPQQITERKTSLNSPLP